MKQLRHWRKKDSKWNRNFFQKNAWTQAHKEKHRIKKVIIKGHHNNRILRKHFIRISNQLKCGKIIKQFLVLLKKIKKNIKMRSYKLFNKPNKKWKRRNLRNKKISKILNLSSKKAFWKLRIFFIREYNYWKQKKLPHFIHLRWSDKRNKAIIYLIIDLLIRTSTFDRVTKPTRYNFKAIRKIRQSLYTKLKKQIALFIRFNTLYNKKIKNYFRKIKCKTRFKKKLYNFKNTPKIKKYYFNLFNCKALFIGGSSEKTNIFLFPTILFCKNNVNIISIDLVRARILNLYASFKWLFSARMSLFFYKNYKFMFATITPVFAKIVRWAAKQTIGLYSANRWTSGKLSGTIKIPYLPNYLFIPDIDENSLIVREAIKQNIAIISIISTDSLFNVDLPILGNNKEFKFIAQIMHCIICFSKHYQKAINLPKDTLFSKTEWFSPYAFPKKAEQTLRDKEKK